MAKDYPSCGSNTLIEEFNKLRADVDAIRDGLVGVTAQLDLDGTVTDTDYASNNDPAALTSDDLQKGT